MECLDQSETSVESEREMVLFYVYVLRDNSVPFYVGKGTKNRMFHHERDATRPGYRFRRSVHEKISKVLHGGRSIEYEVISCDSEQQAFDLEQKLILEHGRKDLGKGTLCNLTDGGEGVSGQSADTKQKRLQYHLGAKRTSLARHNMSMAQRKLRNEGWSATNQTRERQRAYGSNRVRTPEQREKIGAAGRRQVCKMDLDGKVLGVYASAKEAARAVGLKNSTSISKCCTHPGKYTAGGFFWELRDPALRKQFYGVLRTDLNGENGVLYDTAGQAATESNCSASGIVRCCNGQLETYIGYRWDYRTKDARVRIGSKKITQRTLQGDIVAIHNSVFEAAKSVNKTDVSTIYRCCKGEQNQTFGYKWDFVGSN